MAKKPRFFMVERDGRVVIWRFYNPPNNIFNPDTAQEFNDLVEELYANPELRVGILTSAMPDVFILHWDVGNLVQSGEAMQQQKTAPEPPVDWSPRGVYRRGPKVVIAAINANVSGGGLELSMACDFRFMAKNAAASQSEVNVGILPGGGGTQRMTRLVGLPKAMELMLTGRPVYAEEAERIGLITRAVDPMMLMTETLNFAKAMAERPPLAVAHIKKCIYEGCDMEISEGLMMESKLFQELVKSPEAMERMRAYVATGQPSPRQRVQMELEATHKKWKEYQENH